MEPETPDGQQPAMHLVSRTGQPANPVLLEPGHPGPGEYFRKAGQWSPARWCGRAARVIFTRCDFHLPLVAPRKPGIVRKPDAPGSSILASRLVD